MNVLAFCPIEESIKTHCDSIDAPGASADDYLLCADYLVDYVKSGQDLHFEYASELESDAVIGDYMADTKTAFNEFKLSLTDPIEASLQANRNLDKFIADSIYKECLKNEAFPIEYNFEYAA